MRGIVIAGTHSGCGKTTVTLGLLAALKKNGLTVQSFKTGPDFIDSGIHRLITGRPSRNLDLWMCGEAYVRDCFELFSADAEAVVVEGVMGMYDGKLSTAHLAAFLDLPVILVVDAYGMAESAGAIVKGFADFGRHTIDRRNSKLNTQNSTLRIAGVIFNRVASERHYERLRESVHGVPVLGYLPRDLKFEIPHRHLGLTVAEENPLSEKNLDRLADTVLRFIDVESILRYEARGKGQGAKNKKRRGSRPGCLSPIASIAVAYDKAFCFYYEDNLDLLRDGGMEVVKFSPLADSRLPRSVDAVYIGGGYPELHALQLSANKSMLSSIQTWADEGRPLYAECGGLMYLSQGIYDFKDAFFPMAGVFPFETVMKKGRSRLGYREILLH
ncbi:MAG TPA: cobyrinate a,c-diamide synthase, partial [Thermodesulfovibrionales bacterium]|nr:cobyrinate a,c-diamide synthase [Thermodesulfovibrionales bacterium]